MSTPEAGWYPTGDDGDMRYWDGSRWTEHTHPGPSSGLPGAATSGPTTQNPTSATPDPRLFPGAGWFGWGGLLLVAALGAASSGLSGAVILSGLFVAVVAVVALVRGRVGWAHLRGRPAGGAALGTAVALFAVGAATADPQPAAAPQAGPATPTTPPTAAAATTTATTTAPTPSSTTTTAPAPTTTPPAVKPAARAAAKGTALAAAEALPVKGRAAKTGYDRDLFGQAWFDADRNGCDTRIICTV